MQAEPAGNRTKAACKDESGAVRRHTCRYKVKKKRLSASNLTESLWNRIGLPIPEFVIIEKRQCSADDEACAGVRQSFHDKCKEAGCRAVVDNGTSGKDKDDACDTCSEDEVVVNPEKQRIFANITLVHFAAQGAEEPEDSKQSKSYVRQKADCLVHETDAGGFVEEILFHTFFFLSCVKQINRTKRLPAGSACIFL